MTNYTYKQNNKHNSGFTLIEILISVFIISALTVGIFNLITYSLKISTNNKYRVAALIIANQKMEYARNLPYDDVGTVAGIVIGVIPDNETINENGNFNVNTFVQYIDDPFDGIEDGVPDDTLPTDYKLVRVKVSWNISFGARNITTYTKIAPRGIETSVGGGTLSVLVFDANGLPVENANVHIENNDLLPVINFDAPTNSAGKLNLPGAPESIEAYEIIITKAGYNTDYTASRTAENLNPTKPHATVLDGQKTDISFAIDLLSNLTVETIIADLPDNWQVNNDAGAESQTNARIAIDNAGFIYLVWQDYRQSSASKIYAQKYDSNGNAQWPNPGSPDDITISTANDTVVPDILVDSAGNLYISWHDDSTGNKESYLVKRNSTDGSDIWGSEKKINTIADSADQSYSRIALTDDSLNATTTVVWQDNRNTDLDIFMQIFNSAGDKQLSPELRTHTNPISDGTDQYEPAITTDSNGNIYVAWSDNRDGDLNIYGSKYSSSAIFEWEKIINTDASATDQYQIDLTVDSSNNLYAVWTDKRNGNKDIYAQKYNVAGTNLWAADIKINTDSGNEIQYSPSIAIDSSDNIYIVWTDERNGNKDIYAQKYDTNGNALWTNDLKININMDTSDQYNPDIIINPTNDTPYASWQDDRNGNLDIYATAFDEYGTESTVANVPIVVNGAKRIGENPIIYKYSQTFTSGASGEVVINNIEWDSYTIELGVGYVGHTIIMSEPVMPINLEPNTSQTIKLYLD